MPWAYCDSSTSYYVMYTAAMATTTTPIWTVTNAVNSTITSSIIQWPPHIQRNTAPVYRGTWRHEEWLLHERVRRPAAPPKLAVIDSERRRRGRAAVQRSIELFRRLRSDEEIRTFLRGDPLLVRGHRFDYRIRKREKILRHTIDPSSAHIPYDLHLLDKETGNKLAQGCVIVPHTPVIDQLLAFLLHTDDPDDELEMLNKTNWTPRLERIIERRAQLIGPPIHPRVADADQRIAV